ncbi:DUF4956 domain-containing protein [bacterium SCSIO 12643]|nr:DUF4956 domain-containing protein [bacterium SCSIO 12643]
MILEINPTHFFESNLTEVATLEFGVRFLMNTIALAIIILKIYQPTRRDQEYMFTYLIFGPIVFFMVSLFAQTQLGVGFAFGLFAVFSILRYRTTTIPVKEMTYMFTVISISVINAITTEMMVWSNLLIINLIIVLIVYLTEKAFYKKGIETQIILYEKIENIHPDRSAELIKDLEERTGNQVEKFDVLESDYLRDSVRLRIYYRPAN